jgi:hypothetical protein
MYLFPSPSLTHDPDAKEAEEEAEKEEGEEKDE